MLVIRPEIAMRAKINANKAGQTIYAATAAKIYNANSQNSRKGSGVEIIICFRSHLVANMSERSINIIVAGTTKLFEQCRYGRRLKTRGNDFYQEMQPCL